MKHVKKNGKISRVVETLQPVSEEKLEKTRNDLLARVALIDEELKSIKKLKEDTSK